MTRPFSDIPPLARVMLLRLQILWIESPRDSWRLSGLSQAATAAG